MSCWFCLDFVTHIVELEMGEVDIRDRLQNKYNSNPLIGYSIVEHLKNLRWALSREANKSCKERLVEKIERHEKYLSILRSIHYVKKFENSFFNKSH